MEIQAAIEHLEEDFLPGADIYTIDGEAIRTLINWVKTMQGRNLLGCVDDTDELEIPWDVDDPEIEID